MSGFDVGDPPFYYRMIGEKEEKEEMEEMEEKEEMAEWGTAEWGIAYSVRCSVNGESIEIKTVRGFHRRELAAEIGELILKLIVVGIENFRVFQIKADENITGEIKESRELEFKQIENETLKERLKSVEADFTEISWLLKKGDVAWALSNVADSLRTFEEERGRPPAS